MKSMMALPTKAHHLLNRAQQEAEYELEVIECMTAAVGRSEELEGGFISFDQHALMLSTIDRLIDVYVASLSKIVAYHVTVVHRRYIE
jgi:hypothetical protein